MLVISIIIVSQQQVHQEGRHQCPICPNVYKNGSMLKDHILKHQGIRKYKCEVCAKNFAQRTHLTTHMAVHDEKRFLFFFILFFYNPV